MLGAFSLRLLPLRHRADLRLRRLDELRRHRRGGLRPASAARCCCSPASACSRSGLLFKVGAAPFHAWTPDVYQGAPTAVTALHGGLHQGRRVRCAAAAVLRRLRRAPAGTGTPMIVDRRDPDHGWSARSWRSPRPTSSGCWPTPRSRTPGFLLTGFVGAARSLTELAGDEITVAPGGAVLPGRPTASRRSARSRSSPWSATPAARRPTCPAGPGWARSRRSSRASSRSSCSRMAGIPLTSGFTGKWAVFAAALVGRRVAAGRRRGAAQRGRGVLLRPGDRADVLLRARSATGPTVDDAAAC